MGNSQFSILGSEELFKVAKIFTTDLEEAKQKYWYYIDNEDLSICYKNNAILFIKTVINKSYGITLESFYESNISNEILKTIK